jgi:copper homeostasis protein
MAVKLEVCVDTIDGAIAAQNGGADRIELCSALSEGGLTPSAGLIASAAHLDIPSYVMIRPRCGDFVYSPAEITVMLDDIAAVKQAGLAGVVLGAQTFDGGLDTDVLDRLIKASSGLGVALHRVIDVTPDPLEALEDAIELGIERVLTSGGAEAAVDGTHMISQMMQLAAGRITIMPGSGITAQNVGAFIQETKVTEVHASCAKRTPSEESFSNFSPHAGRKETCINKVKQLITTLRA